jgi:hypothetical protein
MPIAQYQQMMAQKNQQTARTQVCPASGFVPGPGHYAACDAYLGDKVSCTPGTTVPVAVPAQPPAGCGAVASNPGGASGLSAGTQYGPGEEGCIQISRDSQGMPVFHNSCSFALRYFWTPINPRKGEFKEQNGYLDPGETQTGAEGAGEEVRAYACQKGYLVVGPDGSPITQAVTGFFCVKP